MSAQLLWKFAETTIVQTNLPNIIEDNRGDEGSTQKLRGKIATSWLVQFPCTRRAPRVQEMHVQGGHHNNVDNNHINHVEQSNSNSGGRLSRSSMAHL